MDFKEYIGEDRMDELADERFITKSELNNILKGMLKLIKIRGTDFKIDSAISFIEKVTK